MTESANLLRTLFYSRYYKLTVDPKSVRLGASLEDGEGLLHGRQLQRGAGGAQAVDDQQLFEANSVVKCRVTVPEIHTHDVIQCRVTEPSTPDDLHFGI